MALLVCSQRNLKFGSAEEDLAGDSFGCLCSRGLLGCWKFVSLKSDPAHEKTWLKSTSDTLPMPYAPLLTINNEDMSRGALCGVLDKDKHYGKIKK